MAGGAAVMTFDEAWPILQEEAINKLIDYLQPDEPFNRQIFTSADYMRLYTVVYNVASPIPLGPEVDKLYKQYKKTFEDYISSEVLPSLRGKESNDLLKELLRGWKNHKFMLLWLSRIFYYLSRYYISKKGLPSLAETSHSVFYDKIEREREGEKTDQPLAKQVLSIFEEIGGDALENYENDIEEAMVEASAKFYSAKALDWMATMSYEEYMLKVEQCLEMEKSRVSEYLKLTNKNRVLEVVQHELLNVHAEQLEEKRASS
ncbi:cullin-1-like isoform X2 [Salvia miltiorrhiza]|uniref:cullin-1-like isoform X2 n=1 Tax=Salvia miltiorrhiza TaxID=226208 RepID=UPI0025ABD403|nr:cullin-1-like isoform X2 [Salvia miltiorrhiza]